MSLVRWYAPQISNTGAIPLPVLALGSYPQRFCPFHRQTSIGDRAVVVSSTVGKASLIGAGSMVLNSKVGDGVSIGMGSKVFKGCTIGANAILAAGSVLPADTTIPAGEMWGGSPAKKIGMVTPTDSAGIARTAEATAELAKLHMDEAWKHPGLVEQEKEDWKREVHRTPARAATLRYDPKWVPLPTLGEKLNSIGVHDKWSCTGSPSTSIIRSFGVSIPVHAPAPSISNDIM